MKKTYKIIAYLVSVLGFLYLGYVLYYSKQYQLLSFLIVVFGLVLYFIKFESKAIKIERLVIIAAFTAITSLSRIIFNMIPFMPGFNPVAAIIIIISIVFGKEVGFMVGALTALVSNMYLAQGIWTPFQMLSWGIVGYLAGVLSGVLKKSKILLLIYGIFGAVIYSFIMDVYYVLSMDNTIRLSRLVAAISLSAPFTLLYIIANFIFILLFSSLFLERLERIVDKYEIM